MEMIAAMGQLRRAARRISTQSPRKTARWIRYHLYERYREWSLGIHTAGCERWRPFHSENHPYVPLSYEAIETAFSFLDIRPGTDVFLDYGCGKGRIVAVAAMHPFRRVIGIEISTELRKIAEDNMRKVDCWKRCGETEIVSADATQYDVPADVSVVFLFNPFHGSVLQAVIERLHTSLLQCPRRLTIVYMNSMSEEDPFAACEWLVPKCVLSTGFWSGMRFVVYEAQRSTVPPPSTSRPVRPPGHQSAINPLDR